MKEQLISFKTAKLAKEKGFKIPNSTNYVKAYIDKDLGEIRAEDQDILHVYLAPTQSLLQKWLREKRDRHIIIEPFYDGEDIRTAPLKYESISYYSREEQLSGLEDEPTREKDIFNTYEEALEDALYTSLKSIKTKKQ